MADPCTPRLTDRMMIINRNGADLIYEGTLSIFGCTDWKAMIEQLSSLVLRHDLYVARIEIEQYRTLVPKWSAQIDIETYQPLSQLGEQL